MVRVVNSTIACITQPKVHIHLSNLPKSRQYRRFPGASVRFDGYTAMFFASGRINVLGLKNLEHLEATMQVLTDYLRSAGYNVDVKGTVKNVVTFAAGNCRVNLARSYDYIKSCGCICMLEQELYPALRIWQQDYKWTAMVYHTGNLIVTGTANVSEAFEASNFILRSMVRT
jgi:TATA-box binding protein (TBP) (component of TFIID and TFIIIB)